MATGAERLKEFVVALGFKTDEQQFRAFEKTLEKVTKNVAQIGTAVAATAIVIDKNITVMASRFEKLYYSSQRTGSTVKSLESLEFGAQNIGFAAGQATSLIEGMTSALRTNPGLAALFSTGDKDPTKQFISIIERLKKMSDSGPYGHAIAAQYGAMFGMSEPDLLQAEKGIDKLKEAYAVREKMFRDAGVDPDKVAKNSVAFENDLRKMEASIDIVKTLILERFMPGIDKLVGGISKVVDLVAKADVATGGASTYAIGGAGFLAALGALKAIPRILTGILKRLGFSVAEGAAEGVAGAGAAEAGGGAAAAGASVFIPIVAAILAGLGLGWLLKKTGALDVGGDDSLHSQAAKVRKFLGFDKDQDPNRSVLSNDQFGIRGNNPGNLRSWGNNQSFTRKSGTFASFETAIEGLSAMAGQLRRYAARHIDTVRDIISTYAPAKDHNNTDAYIAAVSGKLRVGADQHLDLNNASTLQALMHAMIQQEQGKDPYSSSTLQAAIAQRLARDNGAGGGAGHTFNSETTIHVAVDKDPKSNAREIGNEQKRVNTDTLRNFLPRVN
jgi:hypothetical protein